MLAALLAVILSLAWTVPAQAANNYSHDVAFEGVGSRDEVNAYKLVGYTNDYNGFRVDDKFRYFLESSDNPLYTQLSPNPSDEELIDFLINRGDDDTLDQVLSAYVSTWGNNPPSNPGTASGPSASLSFGPGYYLVLPTVSDARLYSPLSLFVRVDGTKSLITVGEMAETEDESVTVNLKSQEGPTFEKYLVDGSGLVKTGTTSPGQKVAFAIKVQFGQLADGFDPKPVITDTLTNLEFDESSVKVHRGSVDGDVVSGAIKNVDKDDDTVEMKLDWKEISGGSLTTVYVTYEATVTKDIVAGASAGGPYVGTNSAQLTYTKDVQDNTTTTDASEASVYTFGLSLTKLDMSRNALTGAKFQLFTVDGSGTTAVKLSRVGNYYVVDDAGTVTELEANGGTSANELDIRGLDPSQTYVIRESETPNGYFAPGSGWKVTLASLVDANTGRHTGNLSNATVAAENGDQTVADLANITTNGATARLAVKNSTMPVLPSTGGMGTALFTVGGAALMAVAAVAFMLLRRRED